MKLQRVGGQRDNQFRRGPPEQAPIRVKNGAANPLDWKVRHDRARLVEGLMPGPRERVRPRRMALEGDPSISACE